MNKRSLMDTVKENIRNAKKRELIKYNFINQNLDIDIFNKKTLKSEKLDPIEQLIIYVIYYYGYMPFKSLSKIMSPFYDEKELIKVLDKLSELDEEIRAEGVDLRKKVIKKDELETLKKAFEGKSADNISITEDEFKIMKEAIDKLGKNEKVKRKAKKDYILHKERHKYLGDVYMLSTKTLNKIEGTKKAKLYSIPSTPNALVINELECNYLAQKVLEAVLKELERVWSNLSKVDKTIYLNKTFIKYISGDEFFKMNKELRKKYLSGLSGLLDNKDVTSLLKAKNIDEEIRERYFEVVIKAPEKKDYVFRLDKLNSFLKNVESVENKNIEDKRIKYFLLHDLIKENKNIDWLSIVKGALVGGCSNLFINNNNELRDKIAKLCNNVIRDNNLDRCDYPETFEQHKEIAKLQSLKTIYSDMGRMRRERKKKIYQLQEKGNYTTIEADELQILNNELEALDKAILKLNSDIKELQDKNRFHNPKKSSNSEESKDDKDPCITFETMIRNKVYVEDAFVKNKKLVINLVGFDGSGWYNSSIALKKIFGPCEMLKPLIEGTSQDKVEGINYIIINYKLVHSSDSSSVKYEALYNSISRPSKEGRTIPKPDYFKPEMIEGFLNKADYIRRLI